MSFIKSCTLLCIILLHFSCLIGQEEKLDFDEENLKRYITEKVNELRKKKRESDLETNNSLESAADDHAIYMANKKAISHFQKRNKEKYNPKNRVDFYGGEFEIVGENVQQIHISDLRDDSDNMDEELAALLVENWRKSRPHYENIISPNYNFTWTSIAYDEEGNIYACQLFSGTSFKKSHKLYKGIDFNFKPNKPKKCKRSDINGVVIVDENRDIYFEADTKKETGFRWAWPWSEGIVADIVRFTQYPCGEDNFFNKKVNVKGVLLEPVYKKDFRKRGVWRRNNVKIYLGKVPEEIEEPYAVNLTVISRKRTCGNIIYDHYHGGIDIKIDLPIHLEKKSPYKVLNHDTTIVQKVYFDKSSTEVKTNLDFSPYKNFNEWDIDSVVLTGFASIEGDFERNKSLFLKRTENVKEILVKNEISESLINQTASENYHDFYRDIENTNFKFLSELEKVELNEKLKNRNLSDSLEFILENHRYVKVKFRFSKKDSLRYERKELEEDLISNISKGDMEKALTKQHQYIGLLEELEKEKVENRLLEKIPKERKTMDLLFNFELYNYLKSDKNQLEYLNFKQALDTILVYDEKHKLANSTLTFFRSKEILGTSKVKDQEAFFLEVIENRRLDRVFQARIIIEQAVYHDLKVKHYQLDSPYLYPQIIKFVRKAKLTPDEIYGVASFLNYVGDAQNSFDMLKRDYLKTNSKRNLAFYMNLILHRGVVSNEKKVLRIYENIAKEKTEQFCKLFTEGWINFQLFDDESFKSIYCSLCQSN